MPVFSVHVKFLLFSFLVILYCKIVLTFVYLSYAEPNQIPTDNSNTLLTGAV